MEERSPDGAFWAFDSEFMKSGRAGDPSDVHSVQFSNGFSDFTCVLESAPDLRNWLKTHHHVNVMYGFVALPDLGSIEEWLGNGYVSYRKRGVQTVGAIKYGSTRIKIYDARPLLQSFGLRRLSDCGDLIGYPKLDKPEWLGLRKWKTKDEYRHFIEYAKADAVITSRIVKWLYETYGANPKDHVSAGTLARDWFQLPKRLRRVKQTVVLSPLERQVKLSCYAGRSEGFTIGYTPNVVYNDVRSLYPCSTVATYALQITHAVPCPTDELVDGETPIESRYGWMDGTFEILRSKWDGLPLRGRNNFYACGKITGFYHTFDLCASHAKVLHVAHAYRPVLSKRNKPIHDKYADMLLKRLEGDVTPEESRLGKSILNAVSGKLGQSKPRPARTSNFFAYSTVLAHSHHLMSNLFDECPTTVLGMDTDSIFSQTDMTGKYYTLDTLDYAIPVKIESKGKGNLAFFRSKNYLLKQNDGTFVYGRHGWQYWLEDFFKLWNGATQLTTRKDVKHTLCTREREALRMAKGRWKTKIVTLDLEKIKSLLKADLKRNRSSYDSHKLFMEKRNQHSEAWKYEDTMSMKENRLDYPRQEW